MKISDLKQPYRRMAEYLAEKNTNPLFENKEILVDAFDWEETSNVFWSEVEYGGHPPITEGIKKHFPPDFDFSGEEKVLILSLNEIAIRLFGKEFNYLETYEKEQVVTSQENKLEFLTKKQNMSLFDKENQRKIEDENLQNRIYTQLAREGKFDQLPDTCEFSEPVEMLVKDYDVSKNFRRITGKFKGNYMDIHCIGWKNVKLPTPEIDFSQFNPGDILEITNKDNEKYYGLLYLQTINELVITLSYNSKSSRHILKDNILSINKLK